MIVGSIFMFGPIILLLSLILLYYLFKDSVHAKVFLSSPNNIKNIQVAFTAFVLLIILGILVAIYDTENSKETVTPGLNIEDHINTFDINDITEIQNTKNNPNEVFVTKEDNYTDEYISNQVANDSYDDVENNQIENEYQFEGSTIREDKGYDDINNDIEADTDLSISDKELNINIEYPDEIYGEYFESTGYYLEWLDSLLQFTIESSDNDTVIVDIYENNDLVYNNSYLKNGETFSFSPTFNNGENKYQIISSTVDGLKSFEKDFAIIYYPVPMKIEMTSVPEIIDSNYGEYSDWAKRSKIFYKVLCEYDDKVDLIIIDNGISHKVGGYRSGDEDFYLPDYREGENIIEFIATSQLTGAEYDDEIHIVYNIVDNTVN